MADIPDVSQGEQISAEWGNSVRDAAVRNYSSPDYSGGKGGGASSTPNQNDPEWLIFEAGETIPAFGVFCDASVVPPDGKFSQAIINGLRAVDYFNPRMYINGPREVPTGGRGWCTAAVLHPARALYDTGGEPLAIGDCLGVPSDTFFLRTLTNHGFVCMSEPDSATGTVWVLRNEPRANLFVKLQESLDADSFAAAKAMYYDPVLEDWYESDEALDVYSPPTTNNTASADDVIECEWSHSIQKFVARLGGASTESRRGLLRSDLNMHGSCIIEHWEFADSPPGIRMTGVTYRAFDPLGEFMGTQDVNCCIFLTRTDTPTGAQLDDMDWPLPDGAPSPTSSAIMEIERVTCVDFLGCPACSTSITT
jgi:hypothetical protein